MDFATPPTPWLRRIGCITTSRADSGIYRPLWRALAARSDWELTCLAGGTHLSTAFGHTLDDLTNGPPMTIVPVDHQVPGDDPQAVAETAGRAVTAFSEALAQAPVDLVFVLGDRTEMLAAAMAALIHRVPIAHLHGGDRTEGSLDNQCRHALTKLSHLHFPALPEHAGRIRRMGEEDWRIHQVGALALDALARFEPEPAETLGPAIGLDLSRTTVVVAFHPETLADEPPAESLDELLAAVGRLDANVLLIGTNADAGHAGLARAMERWASERTGAAVVRSLPQHRFWSWLAHAAALVGNSSAGLIEAASLRLPVVNIGHRQQGRRRPANVIDAPPRRADILSALRRAIDPKFRAGWGDLANPYGDGHAADRIIEVLRQLPPRDLLLRKRWAE